MSRPTLDQIAEELEGPILTADDVEWIVNDIGELGVKIRGGCYFLYKGRSLVYENGEHEDGDPMLYRPVGKREFGETCHPVDWYDNHSNGPRYEIGDGWLTLPVVEGKP